MNVSQFSPNFSASSPTQLVPAMRVTTPSADARFESNVATTLPIRAATSLSESARTLK